ncbi:MAG: hypothetical protein ACK4RV_11860 [Caulobacter sp.]
MTVRLTPSAIPAVTFALDPVTAEPVAAIQDGVPLTDAETAAAWAAQRDRDAIAQEACRAVQSVLGAAPFERIDQHGVVFLLLPAERSWAASSVVEALTEACAGPIEEGRLMALWPIE